MQKLPQLVKILESLFTAQYYRQKSITPVSP